LHTRGIDLFYSFSEYCIMDSWIYPYADLWDGCVSLKFLPLQGLGKLLINVFCKILCADLIRRR
jgi:hypothetical protein